MYEIRLGNSATVCYLMVLIRFQKLKHSGGDIIFQGIIVEVTMKTFLFCCSGSSGYSRLFQNNSEKLKTTSGGVTVTGTVTATTFSGNATTATTATNCFVH